MAHWKDNITLFLKGCHTPVPVGRMKCLSLRLWPISLSLIQTKFTFSQHVLDVICTFSFDERIVIKCGNTLYETRNSNYVGICLKTAPSKGYSICKYINWTGIPRPFCIKNKSNQHLHSSVLQPHEVQDGGLES